MPAASLSPLQQIGDHGEAAASLTIADSEHLIGGTVQLAVEAALGMGPQIEPFHQPLQ
jgi:hypothetical protein